MLRSLRIRDLAIIEDLSVEFEPGLSVLTGETGAGKSILVDAVGLAIGRRADRELLRAGAERAVIEALFEVLPGSEAHAWALERGMAEPDSGELLVRREISAGGTHRLHINGSPCTLALLKELGGQLLELYGQHESLTLLSPERHLELVDRFGTHEDRLTAVSLAFDAVRQARERLDELRERARARVARREHLLQILSDIDAVDPSPGELDALDAKRSRLRNASAIGELLNEVVGLAYEGEPSASALASVASRRAGRLAELDPQLAELAQRLGSAALELEDVGAGFRDYRDHTDFDPSRLDEVESRRAALERLCLRYGVDEAAVLETRSEAARELAGLDAIDSEISGAQAELAEAERRYAAAAQTLTRARVAAAKKIIPAVHEQLQALALGRARLDVEFAPARGPETAGVPLSRRGAERAEFLLAANPGEPFRPLARVASGGELSRIMLALHAVFEAAGEGRALVFDEVDTGVSGSVADAVGKRLARLAQRHQVLCVTHLPQVAAYADRHHVVRKSVAAGRTRAHIDALSSTDRVQELARMLGGSKTTDAARRHATEMLAATGRGPATRSPRSA